MVWIRWKDVSEMLIFCLAKSKNLFFSEDDCRPTLHSFTNNGWSLRLLEKTLQQLFLWVINISCYSPAGRSVLGELELCPRSWLRPGAVLRPRAQILPIRTVLGRWITFIFFSYWDLKISGKFCCSLQPMCVEEERVRVELIQSARSIANQNKTLQHDF